MPGLSKSPVGVSADVMLGNAPQPPIPSLFAVWEDRESAQPNRLSDFLPQSRAFRGWIAGTDEGRACRSHISKHEPEHQLLRIPPCPVDFKLPGTTTKR